MKFDKQVLKKGMSYLDSKITVHPLLDYLSDDVFSEFLDKYVSPIEDLICLLVFGVGYGELHDSFACPADDDGTMPVAWDRGFIPETFIEAVKEGKLDVALECVDKLEKSYNNFYKEKTKEEKDTFDCYMCKIYYEHHVPSDIDGVTIYFNEKDARKVHRNCKLVKLQMKKTV